LLANGFDFDGDFTRPLKALPNHAFSWSADTGEERDHVISCGVVSEASRNWPASNSLTVCVADGHAPVEGATAYVTFAP
jgi:hypothetical protein